MVSRFVRPFFCLDKGLYATKWWCIAPLFNLKNAEKEGEILFVGGGKFCLNCCRIPRQMDT